MNEKVLIGLDITITNAVFVVGCLIGKHLNDQYGTWISYNGPAIGVLLVGELAWYFIRSLLKWKSK